MKIEKQFVLTVPRPAVWDAMGDVRLVADCLPGAAIVEDVAPGRHKGRFSVKLGPLAANFNGEVAIERAPAAWSATVAGKGTDTRSASRASGSLSYRLSETSPSTTQVDVVSEIVLAGALAQFGKAGVVQEVANRMTAEFVRNLEAKLGAASDAMATLDERSSVNPKAGLGADVNGGSGSAGASLNLGTLLVAIIKSRLAALLRWRQST